MKPPKIGIFYLINGRIVSETASLAAIKPSGEMRAYPRQHYDFWADLQKDDSDLADLDCYSLPRGRVTYNEGSRRFEILADRHILEDDGLIARIIEQMNLKRTEVEVKGDEHYRCSVCKDSEQRDL